jgi:hypothetical protein
VVSGVDYESRTVTVEWFERGETKGKGVEIDAILALNPDLCEHPMPAMPPAMPNKLTRVRIATELHWVYAIRVQYIPKMGFSTARDVLRCFYAPFFMSTLNATFSVFSNIVALNAFIWLTTLFHTH